mmetsp:Transcript_1811/g.4529  ORF Transcript_1811/g.4529 Transcript_1811/m.4529 type:complete len:89 (-) Transcript_1811:2056-2322(-)
MSVHHILRYPKEATNLVHGGNFRSKVLGAHSKLAHDNITWGTEAESVNSDNLGGILVPGSGNTSLHSDSLRAGGGKDGLLVVIRLALV